MAILDDTDAPLAQEEETAKTSESPKYVTSEDLNRFRDGFAADMRKLVEGITRPRGAKPQQSEQPESAPVADFSSGIRRERELSDALADAGNLPREGREILRRLVDAEKPENIAEFISSNAKAFARPADPQKTQTQMRPIAANDRQPVSDAGGPAAPATYSSDLPLWQMKPEDRAHLIKVKGAGWFATTLREQLKGVRVKVR